MRVRTQDADGDMTFGQSAQNFLVNSPAAVAQIVETVLRLWLAEWYLNLNEGTPYAQGVLGYNSKATADQTILARINSVEWVEGVQNFESTYDPVTRQYASVSGTLYTQFGTTQFQINNLGNP